MEGREREVEIEGGGLSSDRSFRSVILVKDSKKQENLHESRSRDFFFFTRYQDRIVVYDIAASFFSSLPSSFNLVSNLEPLDRSNRLSSDELPDQPDRRVVR